MSTGLEAVLLDMDGVLINSGKVANDLLVSAAASRGVRLSSTELGDLNGVSGVQFWSYVKDMYGLADSVETLVESYDVSAEVAAYSSQLLAPGVEETIAALRNAGVGVALVTSGSRWRTEHVLKLLHSREDMSLVVCGEDVTNHKPDPEPYQVTATKLGVGSECCLVVEDSLPGVEAARAAGMPVLAFAGFEQIEGVCARADGVIRDFREETIHTLRAKHASALAKGQQRDGTECCTGDDNG